MSLISDLENYLASDEELLLSFTAESVSQGEDQEDEPSIFNNPNEDNIKYGFGATDRRIVYLSNDGDFKDIDYSHISSIETEIEEDVKNPKAVGAVCGICGGIFLIAAISGSYDDPNTALFATSLGIIGIAIAGLLLPKEKEKTKKQKITFITGDEASQQIKVTLSEKADSDIGAELSAILRNQS